MKVHILLLAAGSSSRMGQSKQLMKIGGVPLLVRAAREALAACADVTIVLGAEAEAHRMVLKGMRVNTVENSEWQRGMGNSLKFGLAEVRNSNPRLDAVIIIVCDQPAVTTSHLKALMDVGERSTKPITASSYKDTLGVPVLFKKEFFDELASIGDSHGAAKLIRDHAGDVEKVQLAGGETDLDTINDYLLYTSKPE